MFVRCLWLYVLYSSVFILFARTEPIYNRTNLNNIKTSTSWKKCNYVIAAVYLATFVAVCVTSMMNFQQIRSLGEKILTSKSEIFATVIHQSQQTKYKPLKELGDFVARKPYKTYDINLTTSDKILDMLIAETEQTNEYSCAYSKQTNSDIFRLSIEFIQPSSSIIVNIFIFENSSQLMTKTSKLLASIFRLSNIIYVWNMDNFEKLCQNEINAFPEVTNAGNDMIVDIQSQFKQWYNQSYPHRDHCKQVVDFIDIDGLLCSCPYRPYKSSTDKWSLPMAIMFTFYEYPEVDNNPMVQCLAISKLAMMLDEGRSREDVEAYLRAPILRRKPRKIKHTDIFSNGNN